MFSFQLHSFEFRHILKVLIVIEAVT